MKQVPDPEGPQDAFVIHHDELRVEPKGIPPVLSLFDENALEAALRIKDSRGGNAKITVVSMGKRISTAVLQKALAVGADALVKVEDSAFDTASMDSYRTASILACAIKKIGGYDLVITGRQAADWNAGQVGITLAALLGIPAITLARNIKIDAERVIVERVVPGGYQVVSTRLPALVVASNEVGEMRYPTILQRKDAKKKPIVSWGAREIGMEALPDKRLLLKKLFIPPMRKGNCVLIHGATPREIGKNLAHRLRQDGIL